MNNLAIFWWTVLYAFRFIFTNWIRKISLFFSSLLLSLFIIFGLLSPINVRARECDRVSNPPDRARFCFNCYSLTRFISFQKRLDVNEHSVCRFIYRPVLFSFYIIFFSWWDLNWILGSSMNCFFFSLLFFIPLIYHIFPYDLFFIISTK